MPISFIITSYNIRAYVEDCLRSVAEVATRGDQVILVDDGSNDGTVEIIQSYVQDAGLDPEIEFRPIFLGVNTIGGVGIGANIGLKEANRDTVFFVDGDDWIEPRGFRRARAYWAMHPADVLFTNYLEFDQGVGQTRHPSDMHLWSSAVSGMPLNEGRELGLAMIAVPWRKFYRRAFLERGNLRFPEGDFFFEDNPFHWDVCLSAQKIEFINEVTCCHRMNRPGQTMASTGKELTAFFIHFDTIMTRLAAERQDYRVAACQWLLDNMTWHIGCLASTVRYRYAVTAARALRMIPDMIWSSLEAQNADEPIWPVADRLRKGHVDEQMMLWQNLSLERALSDLDQRIRALETMADKTLTQVKGAQAAISFASIKEISEKLP